MKYRNTCRLTVIFLMALVHAAGCMPRAIDSDIDACPVTGLTGVHIYAGKPPAGLPVPPLSVSTVETRWAMPDTDRGGAYLSCQYGSFERIQHVPPIFKTCAISYDPNSDQITRLYCQGGM